MTLFKTSEVKLNLNLPITLAPQLVNEDKLKNTINEQLDNYYHPGFGWFACCTKCLNYDEIKYSINPDSSTLVLTGLFQCLSYDLSYDCVYRGVIESAQSNGIYIKLGNILCYVHKNHLPSLNYTFYKDKGQYGLVNTKKVLKNGDSIYFKLLEKNTFEEGVFKYALYKGSTKLPYNL